MVPTHPRPFLPFLWSGTCVAPIPIARMDRIEVDCARMHAPHSSVVVVQSPFTIHGRVDKLDRKLRQGIQGRVGGRGSDGRLGVDQPRGGGSEWRRRKTANAKKKGWTSRTCRGCPIVALVDPWKEVVHAGEMRLFPSLEKKLPRWDSFTARSLDQNERTDQTMWGKRSRRHERVGWRDGTTGVQRRVLVPEFIQGGVESLACLTRQAEVQGTKSRMAP